MRTIQLISCVLAALTFTLGCKRMSRDELIAREARRFPEIQCPHVAHPTTRLDSTTYDIPTRTYTYNHTLYDDLDYDTLYTDLFKSIFREKVLLEIRSSIQMRGLKEEGITLVYRYYSEKQHTVFFELRFTKEDYTE